MHGIKVALQYIRRSPYQATAAILVMTLTFFVAAIVFLLGIGSATMLNYFESRPQITAFLKDDKNTLDIEVLKSKLNATGKVSAIRYISKEEALQIYKEQNKKDPVLLEMVTADILPASLEISAKEAKDLSALADILKQEVGVEEVQYQRDIVEKLISWTNAIRAIGLILFSFLAVVSLFIILTVTGVRITLRKEEIEILRLVGASSWYIRSPFLLEGMIYGVVGGVIAWLGSYILLLYASPFLSSLFVSLPLQFPPSVFFMLIFLIGIVCSGGLLGIAGSFLAVKRYLK